MESIIVSFFLFLTCIFGVSAAPVSDTHEKINHFVQLLGKMQNIDKSQHGLLPLQRTDPREDSSEFPRLSDTDSTEDAFETEDSLESGFLGGPVGAVNKRQGAWSYDYGLGGGRFGKRNYGDYGIGGGRFGRDVDHVDLSDANDADMVAS